MKICVLTKLKIMLLVLTLSKGAKKTCLNEKANIFVATETN